MSDRAWVETYKESIDTHYLSLTVNGKAFFAAYKETATRPLERMRREAEEDLVKYVDGFYFYGCGGRNHVFDGDASDPSVYLECTKCGAPKRVNMIYPACLGDEAQEQL